MRSVNKHRHFVLTRRGVLRGDRDRSGHNDVVATDAGAELRKLRVRAVGRARAELENDLGLETVNQAQLLEVDRLTNFWTGALQGNERFGGGIVARLLKFLAMSLAPTSRLGLATKRDGVALASDFCGERADIGVERAGTGVAGIVGGLIGHTEGEDNLPNVPVVDEGPELGTEFQLG